MNEGGDRQDVSLMQAIKRDGQFRSFLEFVRSIGESDGLGRGGDPSMWSPAVAAVRSRGIPVHSSR